MFWDSGTYRTLFESWQNYSYTPSNYDTIVLKITIMNLTVKRLGENVQYKYIGDELESILNLFTKFKTSLLWLYITQ